MMAEPLLAAERVTLLLAIVPYLRESGPVPVPRLASDFGVEPDDMRDLVRFLGTAGVPGETLSYQHEDLFDIDWDALEQHDLVSLTRTVAVDDTPRFAPSETAALIAGLHALTPVLPAVDATRARSIATRLATALRPDTDVDSGPAVSITPDAADPSLPVIVAALDAEQAVAFEYRDAAGRRTQRTVDPISLEQEGASWYLRGICRERESVRTFRVEHMRGIRTLAGRPRPTASDVPLVDELFDLIAVVPELLMRELGGFSPERVEPAGEGRVRIRVRAWHPGAAVALATRAPGEIVVEAPAPARDAVRGWVARALAAYDA